MQKKEIRRKKLSAAVREEKRRRRKRKVFLKRLVAGACLVCFVGTGSALVLHFLPGIRVARQLDVANDYVETKAYEQAIASCEEALEIDSMSVDAYRAMAGVYLDQNDWANAEQVLYRGWEHTQDESLLQEYCVHLLNDAVADINEGNCTFDTLEKSITALEQDTESPDAYKLLDACYVRLLGPESRLFCDSEGGGCLFDQYRQEMERMLEVYAAQPAQELKEEILKFAIPQSGSLELEVSHIEDYRKLLEQAAALEGSQELSQMQACLVKAMWVQERFSEAFRIFESGEFEQIRDFMQSKTYVSIRDQFIAGSMEYWEGKTYIPVSREKMHLTRTEEGQWSFSFADYEEYPATQGVINVWGTKQEDAGVQRLCISYEPAAENGEYYPHKIYEFVYLYSNVKIGNEYVPQMNYRFETRVVTPEGMTSELIGDWGGEHEWMMEY